MKLRNTAQTSRTSKLHDAECMPEDYTVTFDEQRGTVATVRKDVGKRLAAKYPGLELIEPDTDSENGGDGSDGSDDDSENDSLGVEEQASRDVTDTPESNNE